MSDTEGDELAFHYTSREGYEGIKKEGKIKRSVKRDDDVTYGSNKTYLTKKNPEKHTRMEVATGNYDGSPQYAKSKLPCTEVAIGYDPKEIKATVVDKKRGILTTDDDLPLSKAKAIYEVQKDGSYKKDEGK